MVGEIQDCGDEGEAEEEEDDRVYQKMRLVHLIGRLWFWCAALAKRKELGRTKGKFLPWCKHVDGKGDFNLNLLLAEPFGELGKC